MSGTRGAAGAAVVLGVLALAAIPAAIAASQYSQGLGLLRALYGGVPVAVVLGLAAVGASRRARYRRARSVRPSGVWHVRFARTFAFLGVYAGVTGALALGVYGILRWAQ